jgi:hypothetical protein
MKCIFTIIVGTFPQISFVLNTPAAIDPVAKVRVYANPSKHCRTSSILSMPGKQIVQ